jgi:hypothetical protein
MPFILLKAANNLFTSELKAKASDYLGETEDHITKALGAIVPCLLGFFAEKNSIINGSGILASMIKSQYSSGAHLNLEHYFSIESGSLLNKGDRIAGELLGNRTGNFIGTISDYAGIKPASAACLLSVTVPALLALTGSSNVSGYDGDINRLFDGKYKDILAAIPGDFNAKSILTDTSAKNYLAYEPYTKEKKDNRPYWLFFTAILILGAIISWYYFWRRLQ